jgi:hypothetical protein
MADRADRVDHRVRLAVEALPEAPVRWDRVARRTRRRRWFVRAGLVLAGFALAVIVATGFIAGKSALDPSYMPPLVSRSDVSAEFKEPSFGHGLTPLAKFDADRASYEASLLEDKEGDLDGHTLGYVFKVSIDGLGQAGDPLKPRWRIRRRGSAEALPLSVLPGLEEIGVLQNGPSVTYTAWVQEPARAGQFVVDFSLHSPDGVLASDSSSPIHVVTKGLLVPYSAPSYTAGLPRGWHIASDYEHESPHRFVTRMEGPEGMSVLIDTTRGVSGDPADSARNLEDLLANGREEYRRIDFSRHVFGGPAFEWSFEVGDHASTDIFFYRGHDGFAVLAESPAERFRESRQIARSVARSLKANS